MLLIRLLCLRSAIHYLNSIKKPIINDFVFNSKLTLKVKCDIIIYSIMRNCGNDERKEHGRRNS